jgi:hypothetical protein
MGLPSSTQYYAYDIHRLRVLFLNHYFRLQGLPPLAIAQDVLVHLPQEQGDVALILKEAPRFEQRARGCSLALFDALAVRYLVVSFPRVNLTGQRDLTMGYRELFHRVVKGRPWRTTEIAFENELVFCVDKS